MKKSVLFVLILMCVTAFTTTTFAAERNMLGNWSVTFKGYYGNKGTGATYGSVVVTFHIIKQKGRAFAGTAEIGGQADTYLLTGNVKNNEIVMVMGGNIFIRGSARDTACGTKLNLMMETQQMSEDDTQGVLEGTASKI